MEKKLSHIKLKISEKVTELESKFLLHLVIQIFLPHLGWKLKVEYERSHFEFPPPLGALCGVSMRLLMVFVLVVMVVAHSAPRGGGNSKWLFSYSTFIFQPKWGRNIWITRCKRNFDSNSVTFSDILSFMWLNFFSMDPEFLHFFKYFSENWS